jgi:restriction endonuclease S subunit
MRWAVSDLPVGWVETTLGEIASLITKGTTPTSLGFHFQSSGIPFVKIENIKDWKINKSSIGDFISNECHDALKRSQLAEGDVLFSIAGTIGKTAVVDKDSIPANTNQAVAIIRGTSNVILPRLLMLELAFLADDFAKKNARGGAMNNISLGDIKSLTLSIPPLNEQKRITDKLNSLLARVDSCQTHLERVPQILKRFRQSVLAAATTGRLTEDWREKHEIDITQWKQTTIGNASSLVTKGASPNWQGIAYVDDPAQTLFVTSENVGNGRLLLEKKKYVENAFNQKQKRSVLQKDDVLTNIVGASIGRTAIFDIDAQANINQAVCVIRVNSALLINKYLMHYLNSDTGVNFITEGAVDVARANVSLTTISNIPINLPTLDEQAEIVRRVEKLFAYAERLEARYTSASEHVERLTPSLLAKAFRGELVRQE